MLDAAPPSIPEPESKRCSSNGSLDLKQVWCEIQDALRQRVLPEQFETWFRRATLRSLADSQVDLAVQNNFSREWLENYYREQVEESVELVLGSEWKVTFSVDPELLLQKRESPPEPTQSASIAAPAAQPRKVAPSTGSPGEAQPVKQGGLLWNSDVVLNHKYIFENFVVGPCNRFPHAAAMGVGESPGQLYNPFFLHGSVGLGKTHLLQSICFSILDRWPETRILYLSCETFVNHFINALENGDLATFRHKYRNIDVLVVDDIHLLANKERTQEEFFHTFNTLYNAGKQIVLSSDSPPKDIPTLQERLVSRFKWGLVTEIELPCYETRMAIVKRKSRERGHEIPDDVAQLLAERIETNVRELEGAVNKLIGYAHLTSRSISIELAREALRDVFETRRGEPSMDDIVQIVTEHFGVKLSDLQSKRRTASVTYPRQLAMYLARKVTRHSLEEIGRFFGGRDHSTVLYALERIEARISEDGDSKQLLDRFFERLRSK